MRYYSVTMTKVNGQKLPSTADILVFVSDLMMETRIINVVNKLGGHVVVAAELGVDFSAHDSLEVMQSAEPVFGRDAKLIDQITNIQPGLLIFDLADSNYPWREWIALIKSIPATRRLPIICFGQHIDSETLSAASKVGADLVVARSRFVSAMPDLIAQNIRIWDHEAIAVSCQEPLSEVGLKGLVAFNKGDYFEAHEYLEDAWNEDDSASRDVYKAVLQVAVAYLQIQRQNYRGAVKMFLRARQWLQPLPDECRGINIRQLQDDAERVNKWLNELGPEGIEIFNLGLLQPILYAE